MLFLSLVPLPFDTVTIADTALWALALYLGFSPLAQRLIDQIIHWLTPVASSPGAGDSQTQDSAKHSARKSDQAGQPAALASLLSVIPFLVIGGLAHYGLTLSLGGSWAISLGFISCIGCGVYELGRQDGQASG
jgi:hypothetical protein